MRTASALPSLAIALALIFAGAVATADETPAPDEARTAVVHETGRVLLRTPVGSFETRQQDLPPELLEAVLGGGNDARRVYAGGDDFTNAPVTP